MAGTVRAALGVATCLALASGACGRTGLDAPVTIGGRAGSSGGGGGAGADGAAGAGLGGRDAGLDAGVDASVDMGPGVECINGELTCMVPNIARLCVGGAWTDIPCPKGCLEGVCEECTPSTTTCPTPTTIQVCSAQGIFQPVEPCPAGCVDGVCGAPACKDGETRCVATSTEQICKSGVWSDPIDCPFVCVDNACGQSPRKVFVTSETFMVGEIGGLTGADDICRKFAVGAGLSSSFAAWLSDSTGSPASRFPKDVGPYELVDGTIIADSWADLTSSQGLAHTITLTELGSPPVLAATAPCGPRSVWTDTKLDGTLDDAKYSCDDWSNEMAFGAIWGVSDLPQAWASDCGADVLSGRAPCALTAALYCFEQ